MEFDTLIFPVLIILVLAIIIVIKTCKTITVFEYQNGLLYKKGKLIKVLNAGKYYYFNPSSTIFIIDKRPKTVTVAGQEVLTSDSVSIKVSIILKYRVTDAVLSINSSEDYVGSLYTTLQTALRALIGETTADDLLQDRNTFNQKLFETTKDSAADYGLELLAASIKDIMFPGELKKVFTQVIKAKKEGLAALEKARGESASLRNLANAAKMLEDNPNLALLRMMQAVSDTPGNTIVMNLSPKDSVLPISKNNYHENTGFVMKEEKQSNE